MRAEVVGVAVCPASRLVLVALVTTQSLPLDASSVDRPSEPVVRQFPILNGGGIPWDVLALHEATVRINHFQSLEQLEARGGLSPVALLHALLDVTWSTRPDSRALQALSDYAARERLRELAGAVS